MNMSIKRVFVVGIVLLTSSLWISTFLLWLANEMWKAQGAVRHMHYDYVRAAIQMMYALYAFGVIITCSSSGYFIVDRWKHDQRSLTVAGYSNWKKPDFIARRLLAAGVLFLLAPVWCFPLINSMAISMATKNDYTDTSFLTFDTMCIGLEFGTTRILYNTGIALTCLALMLFALQKKEQAPLI